jgi:prepilin-type N-terminal cleavage/methylation domain-containing protein
MKKLAQAKQANPQKGFTLIELLIVIVLIGILSGVLLSVIQPGAQRQRANETVMVSNINKLVMAAQACINSRQDPSVCGSAAYSTVIPTTLGVNNPSGEPVAGTIYRVFNYSNGGIDFLRVDAGLGGVYDSSATYCSVAHLINRNTGVVTKVRFGTCLLD